MTLDNEFNIGDKVQYKNHLHTIEETIRQEDAYNYYWTYKLSNCYAAVLENELELFKNPRERYSDGVLVDRLEEKLDNLEEDVMRRLHDIGEDIARIWGSMEGKHNHVGTSLHNLHQRIRHLEDIEGVE